MDKDREAFEKWAVKEGYLLEKLKDNHNTYEFSNTGNAWFGFQKARQAARALDAERIKELEREKMVDFLPVTNMLVLCGEKECRDIKSLPKKLRALIDGLIITRRKLAEAEANIKLKDRWLRYISKGADEETKEICRQALSTTPSEALDTYVKELIIPVGKKMTEDELVKTDGKFDFIWWSEIPHGATVYIVKDK